MQGTSEPQEGSQGCCGCFKLNNSVNIAEQGRSKNHVLDFVLIYYVRVMLTLNLNYYNWLHMKLSQLKLNTGFLDSGLRIHKKASADFIFFPSSDGPAEEKSGLASHLHNRWAQFSKHAGHYRSLVRRGWQEEGEKKHDVVMLQHQCNTFISNKVLLCDAQLPKYKNMSAIDDGLWLWRPLEAVGILPIVGWKVTLQPT